MNFQFKLERFTVPTQGSNKNIFERIVIVMFGLTQNYTYLHLYSCLKKLSSHILELC